MIFLLLDSKLQILNNVTQFWILEKFHIQIGNFINWRIWSILVVYSCTKIVGYFAAHVRYINIVHRERFKQVFYFIIKHITNIVENRDPKTCTTRYKWKALEIFGYMRSHVLYNVSECEKMRFFYGNMCRSLLVVLQFLHCQNVGNAKSSSNSNQQLHNKSYKTVHLMIFEGKLHLWR